MENEFIRLKITKLIDAEEYAHGVKKYPHHLDQTPNNNASFKQESIYKALYGKKPPKAHRALADCEALEAILTHPEFPKILEPPPPKIQRKCPNCRKVVHRKGAKCPMYETNFSFLFPNKVFARFIGGH